MATMTPMMAAIAAAKKAEKDKKKVLADAQARIYAPGEKVQYWSDSMNRWVDATVRRREEKSGVVAYALDVKKSAPPDRIRPRPTEPGAEKSAAPPASVATSFASFDSFEGKQAKRRHTDTDSEDERRKSAKRPIMESDTVRREGPQPAAAAAKPRLSWSDPPLELLPREEVGDGSSAAFIEHFIRYCIGAWHRESTSGFAGFSDRERVGERVAFFKDSLRDTEDAMEPLLKELLQGRTLNKGETKDDKIKRSGARTSCDGRSYDEYDVLEELERMASLAKDREYMEAQKAYMKLALGNKRWNQTCVTHVSASTMQGAREYRRNRDQLNTYDVDPVSRRYIQGMKKLIQFVQCLRPNEDQSKNFMW